jgi:hypothetical protein
MKEIEDKISGIKEKFEDIKSRIDSEKDKL